MSFLTNNIKGSDYEDIFRKYQSGVIDEKKAIEQIRAHKNPEQSDYLSNLFKQWIDTSLHNESKESTLLVMKAHFERKEIRNRDFEESYLYAMQKCNIKVLRLLGLELFSEAAKRAKLDLLRERVQLLTRVRNTGITLNIMARLLESLTSVAKLKEFCSMVKPEDFDKESILLILRHLLNEELLGKSTNEKVDNYLFVEVFNQLLNFAKPIISEENALELFSFILEEKKYDFVPAIITNNLLSAEKTSQIIKEIILRDGFSNKISEEDLKAFTNIVHSHPGFFGENTNELLSLLLLSASWKNHKDLHEEIHAIKTQTEISKEAQEIASDLFSLLCDISHPTLVDREENIGSGELQKRYISVLSNLERYGFLQHLSSETIEEGLRDLIERGYFLIAKHLLLSEKLLSLACIESLQEIYLEFDRRRDEEFQKFIYDSYLKKVETTFKEYIKGKYNTNGPDQPTDIAKALKYLTKKYAVDMSLEFVLEMVNFVMYDRNFPRVHPFANLLENRIIMLLAEVAINEIGERLYIDHDIELSENAIQLASEELTPELTGMFQSRNIPLPLVELNRLLQNREEALIHNQSIDEESEEEPIPQNIIDESRELFYAQQERSARGAPRNFDSSDEEDVGVMRRSSGVNIHGDRIHLIDAPDLLDLSLDSSVSEDSDSFTRRFSIELNFSDEESDSDSASVVSTWSNPSVD